MLRVSYGVKNSVDMQVEDSTCCEGASCRHPCNISVTSIADRVVTMQLPGNGSLLTQGATLSVSLSAVLECDVVGARMRMDAHAHAHAHTATSRDHQRTCMASR